MMQRRQYIHRMPLSRLSYMHLEIKGDLHILLFSKENKDKLGIVHHHQHPKSICTHISHIIVYIAYIYIN